MVIPGDDGLEILIHQEYGAFSTRYYYHVHRYSYDSNSPIEEATYPIIAAGN
jgi:hypothetical protein